MGKALIIGCGGVASVAIHKCCQNSDIFEEICIASRTKSKCDQLKSKLGGGKTKITTAQVDANNVDELVALIEEVKPDIVMNLALPYQDLTIMDACLATKTNYLDTANYEPEDTAKFEYKWQWEYHERFKKAGITALLGSGFDPGVTGVFSAYALKHHFDEIESIDILDCNAGDHGYPFATNFNPEINIREVSAKKILLLSHNLEELLLVTEDIYRIDHFCFHKMDFAEEQSTSSSEEPIIKIEKIQTKKNDKTILFNPPEIDYIESVEGEVLVNVAGTSYSCSLTLQELRNDCEHTDFIDVIVHI